MDKSQYKIGSLVKYKTFLPSEAYGTEPVEKSLGQKLKTLYEQKKDIDPTKVYRFVGTSEAVDRDGEVILAKAWDFGNYEKNPVVLWSHDRKALPIGQTVGIYLDEQTKMTYFDIALSDSYALSRDILALVKEGVIRATSVGFRVKDWEWNDALEAAVFTDVELFEISLCNVPANQDAVAQPPKELDELEVKTAEAEAFAAQVAQLSQAIADLTSRLETAIPALAEPVVEPTVEPIEEPIVEVPPADEQPIEEPTVTLSEEPLVLSQEMLDSITEAVLLRINQPPVEVTPDPTEPSPSDIPEDDAGAQTPAPEPGENEELVQVGVGDLNETDSFVVVTEEEI